MIFIVQTWLFTIIIKLMIIFEYCNAQIPAKDNASQKYQNGPSTNDDFPIVEPFLQLLDYYLSHKESSDYGNQKLKENNYNLDSIVTVQRVSTTTLPSTNIFEKFFEPFFSSAQQNSRQNLEKLQKHENIPQNSMDVRRSPNIHSPTYIQPNMFTDTYNKLGPLSNLLESIGMNAKPKEEIQIGRDNSISVLGMPLGRRDGFELSPLTGISYGKKEMIGPIAFNDKYNDREPYNKGAFEVSINFPAEYPFKPPKITFNTKIYHPNIDEKGQVCLALIGPENWKPATRTEQVINALLVLIAEPELDHPLRAELAEEYNKDKKKFMKTAEDFTKQNAEKR